MVNKKGDERKRELGLWKEVKKETKGNILMSSTRKK